MDCFRRLAPNAEKAPVNKNTVYLEAYTSFKATYETWTRFVNQLLRLYTSSKNMTWFWKRHFSIDFYDVVTQKL